MTTLMTPPKSPPTTHNLDATGIPLGRLATTIATLLRGKHKATFVHHLDQGDKVVVTNAAAIKLTGRKIYQKSYYHHTGWLGHLKEKTLEELMKTKPEEVITRAVYGMLPRNRLRQGWMKRLVVFAGNQE